jgi:hypothetical protein
MWEQGSWSSGPGTGSGWINEHFINDGSGINQPSPGSSPCSSIGTGSGTTTPPNTTTGVSFNRAAVVVWAMAHWQAYQPYPAACTWFVSQALWAGGLPKTPQWTSAASHGHFYHYRPGTAAAWAVPSFVSYIMGAYPHSTFTHLTFSPQTNGVPKAQLGDVIVYDWSGRSSTMDWAHLAHASLIVGFDHENQPRVAEWGIDGENPTSYSSRFWTWSAKSRTWLVSKYKHVQAFLLHIVPN